MELKFGCEFQRFIGITEKLASIKSRYDGRHDITMVQMGTSLELIGESTREIEKWVILGRPIRLADVLLAVKNNPRGLSYQILLDVLLADGGDLKTKPLWNLRQDDLSLQSEETINFFAAMLRRATEDVTPNEFLWTERAEMHKNAELSAAAAVKSAEDKTEQLLKEIAEFETAAGISIRGGYHGPARNGRLLKFLLDGFGSYQWKASAIADALEGIKEALPYFEELAKISEEHREKVGEIVNEKNKI